LWSMRIRIPTLKRRVQAIGKNLRRDGAEGRDGRHEQPQAESRWMVDEGAVREVALCGVLQTFLRNTGQLYKQPDLFLC
jgi:hypothetical protein